MLRGSIASSNRVLKASIPPIRAAQWPRRTRNSYGSLRLQRSFADIRKPSDNSTSSSNPDFASTRPKESATHAPPAGSSTTPATPSSQTTVPPETVPAPPPASKIQTAPPTSTGNTPPPPSDSNSATPPPPPPPKRTRRFRNLLITLVLLTTLGYAGGTWYSLVNDNFHDFFTEYIPFGEELILYVQERDFHRRFPNATRQMHRLAPNPRDPGSRVTIPSKSGLSWKVSEENNPEHELHSKGRHMNATEVNRTKSEEKVVDITPSVKPAAKPVEKPGEEPAKEPTPQAKPETASEKKENSKPASPKEDRPAAIPAPTMLDPLNVDQANEPLVQDLVKIINDIITAVNAHSAADKFSMPVNKAKDEIAKVGHRIMELKKSEQEAAEAKIKEAQVEFDKSARELLRRIEEARMEEAASFREEFEAEREKMSQSYTEKLKTQINRFNEVAEQRLRNQLLEQAIELKRKFVEEVQSLVENERDGRLSKLSELQSNVNDLEKMASEWNGVIDSNLQTQQLQVAVDAVRSTIEGAERPRPFVRELAALKEISNDDPVVSAAIASINPSAYQRGIPTVAHIVDRFRTVAGEVRKASLLPEEAGIASHAASFLLSKIMFKKSGLAQGDDVESILTRTETLLEEGNLDEAAREMNGLNGWAKTLSQDWLRDVRKVLEVRQALEVIETEARLQCLRVE